MRIVKPYFSQPFDSEHWARQGLVGHWTCGRFGRLIDVSKSRKHGDFKNGASIQNGSLYLDGSNDYADLGANTFVTGATHRTFCGWVYPLNGSTRYIITLGFNTTGNRWSVRLASNLLRIEIQNSGVTTSLSVPDKVWSFISCTLRGSTIGSHTLSSNNIFETVSGSNTVDTYSNSANIGETSNDHTLGNWAFYGYMKNLRLYNRALSNSELQELYYNPYPEYSRTLWAGTVAAGGGDLSINVWDCAKQESLLV